MAIFRTTDFPAEDFSTYFAGTIMRLIGLDGKGQWLKFIQYEKPLGYHFCSEHKVSRHSKCCVYFDNTTFAKMSIDITYPTGYRNTKKSVVYGERLGLRQSYKGLYSNHNYCLTPIESIISELGMLNTATAPQLVGIKEYSKYSQLTPHLANFIFEEQRFLCLHDAWAALRTRKVFSRALSPNFALVPAPTHRDFLIFLRQMPVAELLSGSKIRVFVKEFQDEIKEFFSPHGTTFLEAKK